MSRKFDFVTLDVFTNQRFGGNPLAVLTDARGLTGDEMQTIAREFNLSETTFVLPPEDEGNDAYVRIFTPNREMPFAGHPTIGTAIVMALASIGAGANESVGEGTRQAISKTVRLEENAGLVVVDVTRRGDAPAQAEFTAPQAAFIRPEKLPLAALARAVSLAEQDCQVAGHVPQIASAGAPFTYLPVRDMEALARAEPDLAAWRKVGFPAGVTGMMLYAPYEGPDGADWRTRMFAPEFGVIEDPATGSAAAAFPAQLAACAGLSDGTHSWQVQQGYELGRPSQIALSADIKDGAVAAVRVGGSAVYVSRGVIEA